MPTKIRPSTWQRVAANYHGTNCQTDMPRPSHLYLSMCVRVSVRVRVFMSCFMTFTVALPWPGIHK